MSSLDSCYTFIKEAFITILNVRKVFIGSSAVLPTNKKYCFVCFEEGQSRKCCGNDFCDHCYTKNKACPVCKSATRLEKMTGATYMLQSFSEHEECRKCLDPGLKRRCCGNYYCDDCFYSSNQCPSCEAPVGRKGIESIFGGRASVYSVILGWMTLVFFVLVVLGLLAFISASEVQTPYTVSDFLCNGVFRTCDIPLCIEATENVSHSISSLSPLYDWKYCQLGSKAKLQGWGCAFDNQVMLITLLSFPPISKMLIL